ncbi:hypothetical protein [Methylotenera sp. G11]|uniref:hypothetical protein n=1 Tax=Methylotenera sp. G11 TaxID=1506585 RepID=UPI000648A492|nr:hypothetical protein [Methylotenera sp. G11]
MKLHQKGYLLTTLSRSGSLWDYELTRKALHEYSETGTFREKTLNIALDELSAAGLIHRIEEKLETDGKQSKLRFKYKLSDFGVSRMVDTGLLLP